MPLHDPSTLLLVTVFSQPRRFKSRSGSSGGELPVGGTGRKGSGLIGPNVPQVGLGGKGSGQSRLCDG